MANATATTSGTSSDPTAGLPDSTSPTAVQQNFPKFDTSEPLWYNNGKWGAAGYAIPNPVGKTWTNNEVIFQLFDLVGRNMFELMHRDDTRFYVAPQKQFWYDLHQLIITARKRLNDQARAPNDSNGLTVQHAAPAPRVFLVYPVPLFGMRIRQPDIRTYAEIALLMLSEIMQNSENDRIGWVSTTFQGVIGKYLQEILAQMAMKFFGKTRAQAYDPAFALSDADFQSYDPSKVMTSVEMTEERPPRQWWPTQDDLAAIKGVPINQALALAERWPVGVWLDNGDPSVWPGIPNQPTGTIASNSTAGTGVVSDGTSGTASSGAFVPPPGQAP